MPALTLTRIDLSTQAKRGAWLDVRTMGAKGDGTTDDSAAINAALTSLAAAGAGTLYFPGKTSISPAVYIIKAATLTVPCNGITFRGDSRELSTLKMGNSSNVYSIVTTGANSDTEFLSLGFDGNFVNNTYPASTLNCAINGYASIRTRVIDCKFRAFGYSSVVDAPYVNCVYLAAAVSPEVSDCLFVSNLATEIYLNSAQNLLVTNNRFGSPNMSESNAAVDWWDTGSGGAGIFITNANSGHVSGNRMYGCQRATRLSTGTCNTSNSGGNTAVVRVTGSPFYAAMVGNLIYVNGSLVSVIAYSDISNITVSTNLGGHTGVAFYADLATVNASFVNVYGTSGTACLDIDIINNTFLGLGNGFGTLDVVNGSGAISGINTQFHRLHIGTFIRLPDGDGTAYKVTSVVSRTSIVVSPVVAHATASGLKYQCSTSGDTITVFNTHRFTVKGNVVTYSGDNAYDVMAVAVGTTGEGIFCNNYAAFSANCGLNLGGESFNISVYGNSFRCCGQSATVGHQCAIAIDQSGGPLWHVDFSNNIFIDDRLVTTQLFAFQFNGTKASILSLSERGSHIYSYLGVPTTLYDSGTSDAEWALMTNRPDTITVPEFADNAAAKSGGLTIPGTPYRITGTDHMGVVHN